MDLPIAPRGVMLVSVAAVISFLVVVAVGLRIVRNIKFKKFSWDEPLIAIAMLVQLTTAGLAIGSVVYGNGRHIYQFPSFNVPYMTRLLPWVSQPCAAVTLLIAKASLTLTLLQLGLGRKFNVIVLFAFAIMFIADIWSIVQIITGCSPKAVPRAGVCQATALSVGVAYFQCASNILADVVFFAAPEIFLRRTQLHPRDRVVIRCLLAFIFAATAMSVVKIIYLRVLLHVGDVPFNSPPVTAASLSESGFSIIAACLPAIRQLAGKHFPKHWMIWKTMSSNSTVMADKINHRNKPARSRDMERGLSRASYAPPYTTRDIKLMNEVDLCEEDEDGIKLISYVPRSGRGTPVLSNPTVSPNRIPRSPSITISRSIVEESPQAPEAVKPKNYAESLQGRLSSRFRALDPQERAILADETGSPNQLPTYSKINNTKTDSPLNSLLRSLSRSSARSGDRISRTYSSSSRRSAHVTNPSTSNTFSSSPPQDHNSTFSRMEKVGGYRHQGTDSVYTTTTITTSQSGNTLPNAPFYYENNKIRESARPSMDQQEEPGQQQQQQQQQYQSQQTSQQQRYTSTLNKDSVTRSTETMSQSWL